MLMKILTWVVLGGLFLTLLLPSAASYRLMLEAALFAAMFVFPSKAFLWLNAAGLGICLASLAILKGTLRFSLPSVRNRLPR